MSTNTYDAIVIGSGISGGWAAKELTEKGLKTIMLERGKNIEHIKDYVNANKPTWEFEHRGGRTQKMIEDYPVLKRDYPLNEVNLDYWTNEKESPYTEIKRFDWFRGYHVGGRSLMWGRQSYRWHDTDFEANLKDGIGTDWPIRYKDLHDWYGYAERFAGISGNKDGVPILPDGDFMPPMDMNIVEKDIQKRYKEFYKDARHFIIGRTANITVPHNNRTNCQYRNKCWLGCPFGAYFSTQSATLPAAMATGNLTVRPWSIVTRILYDKDTKKAKGVEIIDADLHVPAEHGGQFYERADMLVEKHHADQAGDRRGDGIDRDQQRLVGGAAADHRISLDGEQQADGEREEGDQRGKNAGEFCDHVIFGIEQRVGVVGEADEGRAEAERILDIEGRLDRLHRGPVEKHENHQQLRRQEQVGQIG